MPSAWRYCSDYTLQIVDASGDRYGNITGDSDVSAEAGVDVSVAYTAKNGFTRCVIYTSTGTVAQVLQVNAADSAITMSITATGIVEDTTNTVSLSAGDKIRWHLTKTGGMHGETVLTYPHGLTLEHASSDIAQLIKGDIFFGGANYTETIQGTDSGSATEAETQRTFRAGATLSKLWGDAATGTVTIRTRINGADGNLSVAWSASSGEQEDTTNSDTVADGDKVNYRSSAASPAVDLRVQSASTALQQMSNGGTVTATTNYGGWTRSLSAEADHQVRARTTNVLKNMFVYATAVGTSNVVTVRINGSDSALTVSPSGTGITEDTSNSITLTATDLMSYRQTCASGTFTTVIVSVEETLPSTPSGVDIAGAASGLGALSVSAPGFTMWMPIVANI